MAAIDKSEAMIGRSNRPPSTWARLFALPLSPQALDVGLLLVRITVGVAFILHGYPKIAHPFSWSDHILAAPPALQFLAAIAEFVGGFAIVAGFATRLFAFLLVCDMSTAIAFVQIPQGARFVATHGGKSYELDAIYWISAFLLFLVGPGRFAIDRFSADARRDAGA